MQGFCNNCKRKPRFCLLDRTADAVFAPHNCAVGTRIAFVIKCFGKFSRKLCNALAGIFPQRQMPFRTRCRKRSRTHRKPEREYRTAMRIYPAGCREHCFFGKDACLLKAGYRAVRKNASAERCTAGKIAGEPGSRSANGVKRNFCHLRKKRLDSFRAELKQCGIHIVVCAAVVFVNKSGFRRCVNLADKCLRRKFGIMLRCRLFQKLRCRFSELLRRMCSAARTCRSGLSAD